MPKGEESTATIKPGRFEQVPSSPAAGMRLERVGAGGVTINEPTFDFGTATYLGYLGIDCPSCGRNRLELYVREMKVAPVNGPRTFGIRCEKCRAVSWNCDQAEHGKGGPHAQEAVAYDPE